MTGDKQVSKPHFAFVFCLEVIDWHRLLAVNISHSRSPEGQGSSGMGGSPVSSEYPMPSTKGLICRPATQKGIGICLPRKTETGFSPKIPTRKRPGIWSRGFVQVTSVFQQKCRRCIGALSHKWLWVTNMYPTWPLGKWEKKQKRA